MGTHIFNCMTLLIGHFNHSLDELDDILADTHGRVRSYFPGELRIRLPRYRYRYR